ncbi:FAA hydrolase family protein [Rhodocyclus tenuis]|uniref:FAA hydrolase family protein n=1 Tax=Rhodocyclus tenuis TaxID=1066 RepID=A0A6L5JXH1_RHOTE|nr:fumarylacetoacetate hydrolase family protein [Rhodocyclus gracilis]MQY51766.1 FAA hydrolase family protein [Rhodocyclus gracilis]MRD73246.1 FAA hydrolase family protein [Rhodocyclus gracilis]
MTYVFTPPPVVSVPVLGSDARFPVRRVYCVGRNYAEHAAEMGADLRDPPFFFAKPADALVPLGGNVPYPPATTNLQHEVELVVALSRGGANITVADALEHVFAYAVGIDFTRRDLQQRAKDKSHPWEMGKAFDSSAPISALQPAERVASLREATIALSVNGQARQQGTLAQMTWSVAEVIAHLSQFVTLAPGDLIFTGTPAGVSTVVRGDTLDCRVDGVGELRVTLV